MENITRDRSKNIGYHGNVNCHTEFILIFPFFWQPKTLTKKINSQELDFDVFNHKKTAKVKTTARTSGIKGGGK